MASAASPTECPICLESFTAKKRAGVQCGMCGHECCVQCAQTYLLTQLADPHCMKCKNAWDYDFLYANLTKSFINQVYKKHRSELMFEHEKSQFPETMKYVVDLAEADRIKESLSCDQEEAKKLREECWKLEAKITENKNKMYNLRHGTVKKGAVDSRAFIHPCPAPECRGFLSSAWKCGVCNLWTCPTCHELLGAAKPTDHVCNEDSVKTVQAMKKETRPCPTCGVPIFKIDGCDQMWCTQCHIAFSWKTGRVVTGTVHNPHYYHWHRHNAGGAAPPRNPGDEVCGGLMAFYQMKQLMEKQTKVFKSLTEDGTKILKLHRVIVHNNYALNEIRENARTDHQNRDLRAEYLRGFVTEDRYKSRLAARDKKKMHTRKILDIHELVATVMTENVQTVVEHVRTTVPGRTEVDARAAHAKTLLGAFHTCLGTCEDLSKYANSEFTKISKNFGYGPYIMLPCFTIRKISTVGHGAPMRLQ